MTEEQNHNEIKEKIEIPKQLQKEEFRFVLLEKQSKKPFEKEWQKKGYRYNDPKLIEHINSGGNYGVICGPGRLRVRDIDDKELAKIIIDSTKTFAVKTGSGGLHEYYISDYDINHVLSNGEFRANNYQVVGSSCKHPNGEKYVLANDYDIKELSKEEVETLIRPYMKSGDNSSHEIKIKEKHQIDVSRSGVEWRAIKKLIKKGLTKEEVFEKMNIYAKWATSSEQYKEFTYNKAFEKFGNKDDDKKNVDESRELLEEDISEYFTDQDGTAYATIRNKEHYENWPVNSRPFKNFITQKIYEATGKPPSNNTINSLLNIFSAKSTFEGKQYEVYLRGAFVNNIVYIDIGDSDWNILKITAEEVSIIQTHEVKFKRFRHMKPLLFDLTASIEDINLIFNHIPILDESDKLLFKCYLPILFLESVPTAILVLYGPQGSGKSMSLKFIRFIVDPSSLRVLSIAKDVNELVQQVSHHYLPFFDNVTNLSKAYSDFFCRVVTGEGYSKRELYSDDEDIIYNYKRKIAFNGINLPGEEPDFLDRCFTVHLARIGQKSRRTEKELWESYDNDRPRIIGAIIKIVQQTLAKINEIKIDRLPRMADYARWCEAVSQVTGEEEGKFIKAYFNKIDKLNKEALEANPVGQCISELMDSYDIWGGTPTELLEALTPIAESLKVDKNPQWPKGSQVLTRKINEITSNLEDIGIKFEFGHTGKKRFIKLIKEAVNTVSTVKTDEKQPNTIENQVNSIVNTTSNQVKKVLPKKEAITELTDNNNSSKLSAFFENSIYPIENKENTSLKTDDNSINTIFETKNEEPENETQ